MLLNLNLGDFYAIMTALCWSSGVIFFEIAGRSLNTLQISLLKNIVGRNWFYPFPSIAKDTLFQYLAIKSIIH